MPKSLSGRLVVLFAILVTFATSAIGVYAYVSLQNQLISRERNAVAGKLTQVVHLIREAEDKAALGEFTHLFDDIARGHPGLSIRITSPGGSTLYASNTTIHASREETEHPPEAANERILSVLATTELSKGGEAITVQVAQSSADRIAILARFRASLLLGTVIGMVLTALLGALLASRELRPTRHLVQQVHKIDVERLDYRVDVPAGPAEVRDIAIAFNSMLERVETGYERLYRFSADLAHDMRTPIANLTGHAEVALSRERTAAEYALVIEESLNEYGRLSRMIEAMLFLARADVSNVVVEKGPVNLSDELQKAGKYFSVLAEEQGVFIAVSAEGTVLADPVLLRRCLNNLLANAVQYADPYSEIQLRGIADRDCIKIQVTNRGNPIADQDLERIFERFYRVDSARTTPSWSTGLGLAIVQSIMELHGGTANAQRLTGRMTRFELRFPHD